MTLFRVEIFRKVGLDNYHGFVQLSQLYCVESKCLQCVFCNACFAVCIVWSSIPLLLHCQHIEANEKGSNKITRVYSGDGAYALLWRLSTKITMAWDFNCCKIFMIIWTILLFRRSSGLGFRLNCLHSCVLWWVLSRRCLFKLWVFYTSNSFLRVQVSATEHKVLHEW